MSPELSQNVLQTAPDAILVSNASGHVLFANDRALELFGYLRQEMVGANIDLLLSAGVSLNAVARRKDGSEFPAEVSRSTVRDTNQVLTTTVIRDITGRRQIEAELAATRDAADRANLAKSRFLATASHDLRQPLQALSLLNGMLRRSVTDEDAAEALEHQERAIAAMSRLLNALLDISKLESGSIKPEVSDFTVAELFEDLRKEFASLAVHKGLRLQVEPSTARIRSDPSLVEQILRNLLSNAIKYTFEGAILLRCLHERASVRIEIHDTGIGISADHIPYIYDEFFQVTGANNTARDGYGLGLSIVTRLVKLLHLKLEVRSQPGKGSSFSLELPSSAVHAPASARSGIAEAAPERPATAYRILLVEDDVAVRNATRFLLKGEGYEVYTAASHAEALQTADDLQGLDLLISDYHLDGAQTGVEVIASLRDKLGSHLKAVLVTGDTSPNIKRLHLDERLRMTSKPVQAEHLLELLSDLLRRT